MAMAMATSRADSERTAITKALALGLAQQVRRQRFGLYLVPSTSEPGVEWTVTVDAGVYRCTCKAAGHPACVHRAAVYLAKVQAKGAKVVGVRAAGAADQAGEPPF
ncbi:MAG: hypothetical protein ACRDI2_06970 [Chloroflexota bacterium]